MKSLGNRLREEYKELGQNKNNYTISSKANYSQQMSSSQKEDDNIENNINECSLGQENSNMEMEELEEN
jgi:hypothetical protein